MSTNANAIYRLLSQYLDAMKRNAERMQSDDTSTAELGEQWYWKFRNRIERITSNYMPSGSGIDSGTEFDFSKSAPERLVFTCAFHHMNDMGMYDGWTEHSVIVTPSLAFGIDVRITGRNRNDIKNYLTDVYREAIKVELTDEQVKSITKDE